MCLAVGCIVLSHQMQSAVSIGDQQWEKVCQGGLQELKEALMFMLT